jgi:deoxyribodipyrimidine photolyase-related protein
MKYFIIYPNQLFKNITYIQSLNIDIVYLVEHPKFFTRYKDGIKLNKLRSIYQKMCIDTYYDYLKEKYNGQIVFIKLNKYYDFIKNFKINNQTQINIYDIADRTIHKELENKFNDKLHIKDSESFLLNYYDCQSFEDCDYYSGTLKQTSFYSWIRKKLNILIEKNGKLVGDKLTYDKENRKQPNKEIIKIIPNDKIFNYKKEYANAVKYIDENIKTNELTDNFFDRNTNLKFPINYRDSEKVLSEFIKNKLNNFGEYQDIFLEDTKKSLLFHSGISPMLNNGLLTPENVVNEILKQTSKIKINNIEGFIRQIIGWREFSKYMYEFHSEKYLNKNWFNCKNKLTNNFYNATTGIKPIDDCIKKGFKNGYLHHIERLMVMSNYMLITEIHPDEVFKWFTEFSLDSYDWVMEFNIYCMATYSDGGNMTTKPYISSTNYILKMSNYNKKDEWVNIWNKHFWEFIKKHKNKIKKIYRLSNLIKYADKNLEKLKNI